MALHRGEADAASEHLAAATRLRHMFNYGFPVSVLVLVELVRLHIDLGDTTGARTVLRELHELLRHRPTLGAIPRRADELAHQLDGLRQSPPGASSMTAAELRLVPYLATHLSFREIGERLYVSRHTVKTQAISIYRKLGVTSRSEAIDRLQAIGLLR
jgi:LuxR family maltose regulon positive regulatory protein